MVPESAVWVSQCECSSENRSKFFEVVEHPTVNTMGMRIVKSRRSRPPPDERIEEFVTLFAVNKYRSKMVTTVIKGLMSRFS